MKCNQSRPGFELMSPCPFPTTIGNEHGDNDYTTGEIVEGEFELQSRDYDHFRANTYEKDMNSSNAPSYGLICTTIILREG